MQTQAIDKNLRIAVLAGGSSSEREVSLKSGENARDALRAAEFKKVDLLDPADKMFIDCIRDYDLAFLAMHGAGGEDGEIQHVLDYLGIPYTASDAFSSACGADKDVSKLIYANAGIPIAKGVTLKKDDPITVEDIVAVVGEESFELRHLSC